MPRELLAKALIVLDNTHRGELDDAEAVDVRNARAGLVVQFKPAARAKHYDHGGEIWAKFSLDRSAARRCGELVLVHAWAWSEGLTRTKRYRGKLYSPLWFAWACMAGEIFIDAAEGVRGRRTTRPLVDDIELCEAMNGWRPSLWPSQVRVRRGDREWFEPQRKAVERIKGRVRRWEAGQSANPWRKLVWADLRRQRDRVQEFRARAHN